MAARRPESTCRALTSGFPMSPEGGGRQYAVLRTLRQERDWAAEASPLRQMVMSDGARKWPSLASDRFDNRRQFSTSVAGVHHPSWLKQECLDLSVRTRAVLDASRHDEELPGAEDDVSVTELDRQLSIDHQEQFVRVLVSVPDEITHDLDQLDLVVVEAGDQPRGPVVGESVERFAEVHDIVTHSHSLSRMGAAGSEATFLVAAHPDERSRPSRGS